jgi:hypothetical protein
MTKVGRPANSERKISKNGKRVVSVQMPVELAEWCESQGGCTFIRNLLGAFYARSGSEVEYVSGLMSRIVAIDHIQEFLNEAKLIISKDIKKQP